MSNVKTRGLNKIGLLTNQCGGHLVFVAAEYQGLPPLAVYGPVPPKMCELLCRGWTCSGQLAQSDSDSASGSPTGL